MAARVDGAGRVLLGRLLLAGLTVSEEDLSVVVGPVPPEAPEAVNRLVEGLSGASVQRCSSSVEVVDAAAEAATDADAVAVVTTWVPPGRLQNDLRGLGKGGSLGEAVLDAFTEAATGRRRLAVTVPGEYLSATTSDPSRRRHMERAGLTLVVEGGLGVFPVALVGSEALGPHAAGALVFYETAARTSPVRFFRVPRQEVHDDEVVGDFSQLLRQGGGETRFGYVWRKPVSSADPLNVEYRSPASVDRRRDLEEYGSVPVPLKALATLLPAVSSERGGRTQGGHLVPLLQAREIRDDGAFEPLAARQEVVAPDAALLQRGDLCIRAALPPRTDRFAVLEIETDMLPCAAARSIIPIRLRQDLPSDDRDFIKAYLSSPKAANLFRARGGRLRASREALALLPIALPAGPLKYALGELARARHTLVDWAADVESARQELVSTDHVSVAVEHVFSLGQRLKQRVAAARRVDDLGYRVRTQLPLPVAYRWRRVEASQPNLEGYVGILEAAEVLAQYVAVIAVLASREADAPLHGLRGLGSKLVSGQGGTTFGDWLALLQEVSGRRYRARLERGLIVPELLGAFPPDTPATRALTALKERRDDFAHGRGPRGMEVRSHYSDARDEMETTLASVEFLAEYPLRLVEQGAWDSLQSLTRYQFRDLMGDHALVAVQEGTTTGEALESHSLYLVGRDGSLRLLRPLMFWLECDVCGAVSAFTLERYRTASNEAVLKSMEHGHNVTRSDSEVDATDFGLLASADR